MPQSAVATVLEVDPASVAPTLRFVEDLRADSVARLAAAPTGSR